MKKTRKFYALKRLRCFFSAYVLAVFEPLCHRNVSTCLPHYVLVVRKCFTVFGSYTLVFASNQYVSLTA